MSSSSEPSPSKAPLVMAESGDRFGGFIGPRNLASWVAGSAPYLFDGSHPREGELGSAAPGASLLELSKGPLGWWRVLRSADRLTACERPDGRSVREYFVLCCAAHWGSVASYVPTDVDAKIRKALWSDQQSEQEFECMAEFALGLSEWDVMGFSERLVALDPGWGVGTGLSGHDGERLSVLAGGFSAAWARNRQELAERFRQAIDRELTRQGEAYSRLAGSPERELDWVRAAAVLTHNAGDVNQGLDGAALTRAGASGHEAFVKLAQEGPGRYGGAFARAASVYRVCLANEGHRNYPLRAAKGLRRSAELLLPIAPFFDAFGERVAEHPMLSQSDRFEVVQALLDGLRRIPGQQAYQRALCGFAGRHPRGLQDPGLLDALSAAGRKALKGSELAKELALPRRSFESSYVRRARQAAAGA